MIRRLLFSMRRVDWVMLGATIPFLAAGLATMYSFSQESYFFNRQALWIFLGVVVFFAVASVDWRFLRRGEILLATYLFGVFLLFVLLVGGRAVRGAQSWIEIGGGLRFQPVDAVKLILVAVLAKYFARRHIHIASLRHIVISGLYAFIPFTLVFFQPDFGSAVIIFMIWMGMVLASGIPKKFLFMLLILVVISSLLMWFFVFTAEQKTRITAFLDPYTDLQGAGYNSYQSVIAVGSGGWFGKGWGYGTQSRLSFLPEYQTDFIFAAFAEEWGWVGVLILLSAAYILLWRILKNAFLGDTNFEVLFCLGVAVWFFSHIVIHVGMNLGSLPVTGLPLPFMSYGGSHILFEFFALGIINGMRRYGRPVPRDHLQKTETMDSF